MLWWVLACTGPEEVSEPSCPPAAGEILRLETGEIGADLDLMMKGTAGWVTLCLGEGQFPTNLAVDKRDEALPGQVTWIGTDGTVLVPEEALDTGATDLVPLQLGLNQPVVFQDLRLELPAIVHATEVTLRNVELAAFTIESEDLPALYLLAEDRVSLEDMRASELQVDDVALYLEAPEITIDGLDYRDNRSAAGGHIELYGEATLRDLVVADTIALRNEPGRSIVSAWNDVVVEDAVFEGNDANGPALGCAAGIDAEGLVIRDHRSNWTGALTLFHSGTLSGLEITDSVSYEGALALYPNGADSLFRIDDSNFGSDDNGDDNEPCDISMYGSCLRSDLEDVETLLCDPSGCR